METTKKAPEIAYQVARAVSTHYANSIQSIIYSPQPFTPGEIYIVTTDNAKNHNSILTFAYKQDHDELFIHHLHENELWTLASTHWYIPSWRTSFPNPSYTIRSLGVTLFGAEVTSQFPLPNNPKAFLQAHIEGCRFYVRNHQILKKLLLKDYEGLISNLKKQMLFLMASAIVAQNTDGFREVEIANRFSAVYQGSIVNRQKTSFFENLASGKPPKERALESVWLFECFLRSLRSITS